MVHHYYGAAELSFVAWGAHADDLTPFPGVDVVVRDGEVWVRTPYLCLGYDGPPGPLRTDPDGFATVGDRGVLADGRLLVSGRSDAVTVGGATVEPADVEVVLREAADRRGGRGRGPAPGAWGRCSAPSSPTPTTCPSCGRPPASGSTGRAGRGCGSSCRRCR